MSIFFDRYGDVNPIGLIGLVGGIALSVILFVTLWPLTLVDETERGIVLTNGAISRVLGPGLHFRLPLFESVVHADLSVRTLEVTIPVYSKDSQVIDTVLAVNYRLVPTDEAVIQAYRESRLDYETTILRPNMADVLESTISQYTAQQLVEERGSLSALIKKAIVDKFADRTYVEIDTVSIDPNFDHEYEGAVKRKQVQEQNALAEVNITKQEEEKKKQQILQAEALAEKTRLEALALASQNGEKVISKIYAEAALEMAKKWSGNVPSTIVSSGQGQASVPFFSFMEIGK